jgi:hypothetical protein
MFDTIIINVNTNPKYGTLGIRLNDIPNVVGIPEITTIPKNFNQVVKDIKQQADIKIILEKNDIGINTLIIININIINLSFCFLCRLSTYNLSS